MIGSHRAIFIHACGSVLAAGLRKNKTPREVTLSCVPKELYNRISEKNTKYEHCTNYSTVYTVIIACVHTVSVTFNYT